MVKVHEPEFFSIIDFEVDSPQTQQELVDAFADLQRRWVRFYPGYRSATIYASVDGHRVYNVVRWASEADFRDFEQVSDNEGRIAAVEEALSAVSGSAESRMTGPPRFMIASVVEPGPQLTGAAAEASDGGSGGTS